MDRKTINLNVVKILLSPYEMKNVLGGSGLSCYCFSYDAGSPSSCFEVTGIFDCSNAFTVAVQTCSPWGLQAGCFC